MVTSEFHSNNEKSLEDLVWEIETCQGQFTLIFAHCNYQNLRQWILQQLEESCPISLTSLSLDAGSEKLLELIQEKAAFAPPLALMILGLELVKNPEKLLAEINQVREEFKRQCPFPVIIWVNDLLVEQFLEIAPDFESWASYTVFTIINSSDLVAQLYGRMKRLFNRVVESGGNCFLSNEEIFGGYYPGELRSVQNYIRHHQVKLPEDIEAGLAFTKGRDAYLDDRIDEAIAYHQKSWEYWETHHHPIHAGAVLFHLGLCACRQADLHRAENRYYWEQARLYFQQCIDRFDQAQRVDLVAKFIHPLGEMLRRLAAWEELRAVVTRAQQLHETDSTILQQVQDRSLLAALKLQDGLARKAQELAERALQDLAIIPQEKPIHEKLPLLLLARSYRDLGNVNQAIAILEEMKATDPEPDPQLYLEGLEELRSLYWQEHDYVKAFKTKQYQRVVEQQFGFIAFIGPGKLQPQRRFKPGLRPREDNKLMSAEIMASGREPDIQELINRLQLPKYKLIIIHGESGVGKSSLIQAGLLPALVGKISGHRDIIPILCDNYHDFPQTLINQFTQVLVAQRIGSNRPQSLAELLENLAVSEARNWLTVLIFDQFEEFFFSRMSSIEQEQFLQFLGKSLNVPFVKIVLSLREDYIHQLLVCNQIEEFGAIAHDILSKNVLYRIGNFSPEIAQKVIENLTENSQFILPKPLIQQIVSQLTNTLGQIRPIELQIVGAQLQNQKITTLDQYQNFTKETLVQNYLQAVIADCGKLHQQRAELVLYLLTDENNTRPLKLRSELESALRETQSDWIEKDQQQLDLVLEILTLSGLVLLIPNLPERYQLVHDYLVPYIRQRQSSKLLQDLKQAQEHKALADAKLNQFLRWAFPLAGAASILLLGLTGASLLLARQSWNRQLESISVSATSLFDSTKELEAMIQAIKGWQKLNKHFFSSFQDTQTRTLIHSALFKINYGIKEKNLIEGHQNLVRDIAFSPDGNILATASDDQTVKLWRQTGELIATLNHNTQVHTVTFAPDGQILLTGDQEKIRIWSSHGNLIKLILSNNEINSLEFSPDGQKFASASDDGKINLWNRDGTLLKSRKISEKRIMDISFSPDGQWIVSGSTDQTIKLWNLSSDSIEELGRQNRSVIGVAFSPDGQLVASIGLDRKAKLWEMKTRTEKQELIGHESRINSLSFSPDGKILSTGSSDSTVKLWQAEDGDLLRTIRGKSTEVWCLKFRPKSDQLLLAIGSGDNKVRLWQLNTSWRKTIVPGHERVVFTPNEEAIITGSRDGTIKRFDFKTNSIQEMGRHDDSFVYAVDVSPNGQIIASASGDQTVKLWDNLGNYVSSLEGHTEAVVGVTFSPTGDIIATGSDDGKIKVWDGQNYQEIGEIVNASEGGVGAIAFSPDGQIIASGGADNQGKLWTLQGKPITTLKGHQGWVLGIDFHPQGNLIATGSADLTVKLWHPDGTLITTLDQNKEGHINWVNKVKFSPDGTLLASASDDSTIKLWNIQDPKHPYLITTLSFHANWVRDIDFSDDGRYLVSASADRTVVRWDLQHLKNPDFFIQQGCDWIRDYLKNNPNVRDEDKNICDDVKPLDQSTSSFVYGFTW